MKQLLPHEAIEKKIFLIRGDKVMIDRDLAALYGVPTKVLIQAVKRNIERFPADFMFLLTKPEFTNLRSQFVTSSWGGRRYLPYVFTEMGVAMLSSVLNSDRAIQVNIQIMRTFTRTREMIIGYGVLRSKINKLESKYDRQFKIIFEAIRQLMVPQEKKKDKIGFI
jgi:hypothetical protein